MWHAAVLHHYHLLRHEHQTNADATAVRPPLIADDMRTQTDQNPPAAERIAEENPRRLTDTTRLKLLDNSKIRKRERLKSSEQKYFWIFAPKNRYNLGGIDREIFVRNVICQYNFISWTAMATFLKKPNFPPKTLEAVRSSLKATCIFGFEIHGIHYACNDWKKVERF